MRAGAFLGNLDWATVSVGSRSESAGEIKSVRLKLKKIPITDGGLRLPITRKRAKWPGAQRGWPKPAAFRDSTSGQQGATTGHKVNGESYKGQGSFFVFQDFGPSVHIRHPLPPLHVKGTGKSHNNLPGRQIKNEGGTTNSWGAKTLVTEQRNCVSPTGKKTLKRNH